MTGPGGNGWLWVRGERGCGFNGVLLQGKNGDGGLTERGIAAFWRRDGDGGTTKRGMGVLVKGRGTVYGQREILSFFKGRGCFVVFIFKR
jgi:hypothetical protein